MYITRHIESIFTQVASQFPIVLLTGPRQVGKSTTLHRLSETDRDYVTLDDPIQRAMANENPSDFLTLHPGPVVIDEIQYAPALFPYLKMRVDQHNSDNQYWITGSQVFSLMRGVQESLAGRVGILRLSGISQQELLNSSLSTFPATPTGIGESWREAKKNAATLDALRLERIVRGQFPRLITHPDLSPSDYYASYVQTWLERDVMNQINTKSSATFIQFVRLLATRSGQELNQAQLSKELQVDAKTIRAWIGILEASGLVYLLPAWAVNLGKRVVKRPKVYLLDTGLLCYLCGITTPRDLATSQMFGAVYETWIVGELLRKMWNSGQQAQLYYYRDQQQKEIDVIMNLDGKTVPIEIKTSATPAHPFKNFAVLSNSTLDIPYFACICTAREPAKITEKGWLLPDTIL